MYNLSGNQLWQKCLRSFHYVSHWSKIPLKYTKKIIFINFVYFVTF